MAEVAPPNPWGESNDFAALSRNGVGSMLEAAQVASNGLQDLAVEVANFSRESVERASLVARDMTKVTSPMELMQLQAGYARAQYDHSLREAAKLSTMMFQLARACLAEPRA